LRLLLSVVILACFAAGAPAAETDWDQVLEKAKGTTVSFYGWGGDPRVNAWLDDVVAPRLREEYGVTLRRVGMNIDEILNKLLGEKMAGREEGGMDVIWINGENFFSARQNGLLKGPFTEGLPNFVKYVDADAYEFQFDFGYPVEGYEAPYGRAQLVLFGNRALLPKLPRNTAELLEVARAHPGMITYPAPPEFTGSAFVRTVICDIVGYEAIKDLPVEKEAVREAVAPAMEYLAELAPYLWMEGRSYPPTNAQLKNMYADGEVLMGMSYAPFLASGKIRSGEFPATTESFLFDKGTVGNVHYLAVPFNAPNYEGALVVINHLMSVEAQASKFDPDRWGDLPVVAPERLSAEEKALFDELYVGGGGLPVETILSHRVPEIPARLIPLIEEIWAESLFQK
jgi:putative spermidine/putrescine transport system substrate-binding protein